MFLIFTSVEIKTTVAYQETEAKETHIRSLRTMERNDQVRVRQLLSDGKRIWLYGGTGKSYILNKLKQENQSFVHVNADEDFASIGIADAVSSVLPPPNDVAQDFIILHFGQNHD